MIGRVSMLKARNPKAVNSEDPFVIAIGHGLSLRAIESHPDIVRAQHARDILAENEEKHGRNPKSVRMYRSCDIRWRARNEEKA